MHASLSVAEPGCGQAAHMGLVTLLAKPYVTHTRVPSSAVYNEGMSEQSQPVFH